MNRARARALSARARRNVGPVFVSNILCMHCGAESEAVYLQPPEVFPCPACGRRTALRDADDDVPYPPPAAPLEM